MTSNTCRKKRPYILLAIFCTSLMIILMLGLVTSQNITYYKEVEILDDLPLKFDVDRYIKSLEKAVNFMKKNIFYVDLNVCFGIFLANVQLKQILQTKSKLPLEKEHRLEHLVKLTNDIVYNFTKEIEIYAIHYHKNPDSSINMMKLLIGNDTTWRQLLPKFNIDLLKKTQFCTRRDMVKMFFKWPIYQRLVYGDESRKDSAKSDSCLSLLAQNPINLYSTWTHCLVPYKCLHLVLNGTNYGYGMTHRALFLLLARFGRGCILLSAAEDREILDSMCVRLYTEAEFISNHDFQTSDLIIEIIALCSLDGHAQFLRRSWIYELLDFQTEVGCFNVTRPEIDTVIPKTAEVIDYQRKLFLDDQMILWGSCNSHTTSVAIAMLASAIRYVVESFY